MQLLKRPVLFIFFLLPLIAGCAGGLSAFNKGEKLEKQGKLDEAVLKYAEAMAANPKAGEYRVRFLQISEKAARDHLQKGEEHLSAARYDDALREFQTAYTLDSSLERASQMSDRAMKLRNSRRFFAEGREFEKDRKMREALASYRKAAEFDPEYGEAAEAVDRLLSSRKSKLDGFELNLKSKKPITLKFRDAKIKEVFNILSQLSGINFVFDEGVKDSNVTIFLENATFFQALDILTGMNKLGRKVLNENTVIVYTKTPDKEKQYEELKVQTFMLDKLDAKKAVNLIRTMLPAKKIYVNEDINAIVMRDTPDSIEVARRILEANDIPDAEVVLEVEIMEISKDNEENFGLLLSKYAVSSAAIGPGGTTFLSDVLTQPTTSDGTSGGSSGGTTTTDATNFLNIFNWRGFGGFMTVPNVTFNFAKTLANGQTLSNPRIRVKNREKAKFTVGQRVPITTTSSTTVGGTAVNVQYVDVGVKMNAEPVIQLNNEITIKVSLEVSTAGAPRTLGDNTTQVVDINNRNLDTVLSLKDGETSIIGGLIQQIDSDSRNKISLLGDIPLIGRLFSNKSGSNKKNELILAITPHIVRGISTPEADVASFWSGKEDDPSIYNPYASFVQEPEIPAPPPAPVNAPAATAPREKPPIPVYQAVPIPPAVPAPQSSAAQQPAQGARQASGTPAAPAAPSPPSMPATTGTDSQLNPQPGAVPPAAPGVPVVPPLPTPQERPQPGVSQPAVNSTSSTAGAAPPPQAAGRMQLAISAPAMVAKNERFNVNVVASNAADLFNSDFVVFYNPAMMDYEGAGEGAFLKSDGKTTTFQATGIKSSGQINVTLARTPGSGGVKGSGTLATLTFRAKAPGKGIIGFLKANITDPAGRRLNVIPANGMVEVK